MSSNDSSNPSLFFSVGCLLCHLLCCMTSPSKVEVMYWPMVSLSVCPGVSPPSGPVTNFSFFLKFFRQLEICYFVAPSLTRGWVCNLLLLLGLATAAPLWSESLRTQNHILLSQFLDSPSLEGQVPIFISPRNSVTQLYPRALGSIFDASYDWQHYGGGILTCLHMANLLARARLIFYSPRVEPAEKHCY
jgi:hypothetical protein